MTAERRRIFRGVLVGALAVAASCGGDAEPRRLDTLVEQGGRYLDPADFDPWTGPVVSHFQGGDGVVEMRARLREGRLDGPYERYYRSGALFGTGAYRAGAWHGPFESFYEDGTPWMSGRYEEGALEGPYRAWDEDGTLVEEGTYEDGARCGTWTEYGEAVTYPPCAGADGAG